jgi:pyrroline-5-carboxylate reductase
MTVAVIGTGKMGSALVRGWVQSEAVAPGSLRLFDTHAGSLQTLADETGALACGSVEDAVAGADTVLLAVKPWLVADVSRQISQSLAPHSLVISIAAGISTAAIEAELSPSQPVLRAMPNTAALVGAGATAICRGRHADQPHTETGRALFGAVGVAVEVPEMQMDAVVGVSGSGIAYAYLFIEALIDGGVRVGLPRDTARDLAVQTVLGAARMVTETGLHPAVLKDQVTTPGGTTIAALDTLETHALRGAVIDAVKVATSRSRELGS